MPIYEYRCNDCRRRVSIFFKSISESSSPSCTYCGSNNLTRLFSSFTMGKGEYYKRKGVYDDIFSDPKLVRGVMRSDPRALAEWNRKLSQTMEQEPSHEYDELTERLEAGEPVEQVMQRVKPEEESEG